MTTTMSATESRERLMRCYDILIAAGRRRQRRLAAEQNRTDSTRFPSSCRVPSVDAVQPERSDAKRV